MSEEFMGGRFDHVELARGGQRDAALQRMARAADRAWRRDAIAPPIAGCESETDIAELSLRETLDAMYRQSSEIRLDLVYSPIISGDFRKRWANRLGDLNLRSAAAAAEIDQLRDEVAVYERGIEDEIDPDVVQIDHKLWRLRELCLHHQELVRSAGMVERG